MNLIRINADNVYCIGDIHGDFESIIGWIKRYDLTNSALLFCGDVGFGFNKQEYYNQIITKIKKECQKRGVYCLFIRGNHDAPEYFNGDLFKRGFVLTLQDYTVIEFYETYDVDYVKKPHKTVLCVGGATSVDRSHRWEVMKSNAEEYKRWHFGISYEDALKKCNKVYWENEQPVYDEDKLNEITDNNIKIEYVCTHTCPSFCEPIGKNNIQYWLDKDEYLSMDLDNERQVMDNLHSYLISHNHPIKTWYYGHYHFHSFQEYDGIRYYLLDMAHNGNYDMVEMF